MEVYSLGTSHEHNISRGIGRYIDSNSVLAAKSIPLMIVPVRTHLQCETNDQIKQPFCTMTQVLSGSKVTCQPIDAKILRISWYPPISRTPNRGVQSHPVSLSRCTVGSILQPLLIPLYPSILGVGATASQISTYRQEAEFLKLSRKQFF